MPFNMNLYFKGNSGGAFCYFKIYSDECHVIDVKLERGFTARKFKLKCELSGIRPIEFELIPENDVVKKKSLGNYINPSLVSNIQTNTDFGVLTAYIPQGDESNWCRAEILNEEGLVLASGVRRRLKKMLFFGEDAYLIEDTNSNKIDIRSGKLADVGGFSKCSKLTDFYGVAEGGFIHGNIPLWLCAVIIEVVFQPASMPDAG